MPWAKGQSGNPRGRHTKARDRLTSKFITELDRDWRKNGADAIAAARIADPLGYVAVVARLLPKDTQVSVTHGLSEGFLAAIRNANDQRTLRGHAGATIEHEPADAVLIPLIDKDKVE